ncbi:uncharacterized protein LOC118152024 [Callithrix jacchus]
MLKINPAVGNSSTSICKEKNNLVRALIEEEHHLTARTIANPTDISIGSAYTSLTKKPIDSPLNWRQNRWARINCRQSGAFHEYFKQLGSNPTSPSRTHLEIPEPGQLGLQAAAHSAECLDCQVPENPGVRPKRNQTAAGDLGEGREEEETGTEGEWITTQSLSHKSTCSRSCPLSRRPLGEGASLPLCPPHGLTCHPVWLSKWEADFRSPYSSAEPLCSPSEPDSYREPVGAGIQRLQKLFQELHEAIMAKESGDMTFSLIHDGGSVLQLCLAGSKPCLIAEASYPRMSVLPVSFLEETPRSHQHLWVTANKDLPYKGPGVPLLQPHLDPSVTA